MRLTAAILFTAITASAQFTIPPFSDASTTRVAQSFHMAQQCYSALVERCDVACFTNPAAPEVANGNRRLVEYKAALSNILVSTWWMDSTAPVSKTNRITPASLITLASLPASFWTNTPLAGASLATNGWHGLRDAIKPLVWSAKAGGQCGSELYLRSDVTPLCDPFAWSASGCSFTNAEAGFYWTDFTNKPLGNWMGGLAGGMRQGIVNPGRTFLVRVTQEYWVKDTATNCPTAYPSPPGWVHETIYDNIYTQYWCETSIPSDGWVACDDGDSITYYMDYESISEFTDYCSTNWLCGDKFGFYMQGVSAGINFDVCGSTNYVFEGEEWYLGEVPTNCVTSTVTWEFDSRIGLSVSQGWGAVRSYTWTNGSAICVTNFDIASYTPFHGSTNTNAVGWAVTDAFLVQKWDASTNGFRYR